MGLCKIETFNPFRNHDGTTKEGIYLNTQLIMKVLVGLITLDLTAYLCYNLYVLQRNDSQTEYKMSLSLMLKILAIALLAPLGYIAFLRDTEFFPNLLLLWAGLMFLGEMLNEAIDEDI